MPNLSIKNVPEEVVAKLRQRAADSHRSLQGELLDLVCRATEEVHETGSSESEMSGWLSIEAIAAELNTTRTKVSKSVPLAVDIIRQERDSR